jgi:mono/diheme cytochrome c family protein
MRLIPFVFIALVCAAPLSAQEADVGATLYADFCAVCHGPGGQGDGPMAEVLTLAPADLTTLSRDGAFPVLRVARQVDGRDPLLAHGGEMPIFGAWFEGEGADVAMTGPGGQPVMLSRPIADLIAYLMEIQS